MNKAIYGILFFGLYGSQFSIKSMEAPKKTVSWSPDGNYALSGSSDKTIKLWPIEEKNKQEPLAEDLD